MKNAKMRLVISLLCIIAVAALAVCGAMIATRTGASVELDKISGEVQFADSVDETAEPAADTWTTGLPDGSRYWYTSYTFTTTGGSYNGDTSATDKKTHDVSNSGSGFGTIDNPYAISTTTDWASFVAQVRDSGNYGKNTYYVLAADVDFNGANLQPVQRFAGKLYGMGHKIIKPNIIKGVTDPVRSTQNEAYGLVCYAHDGFYVSDLTLQDFTATQTEIWNFGGIFGVPNIDPAGTMASISVLNCTVQGTVSMNVTTIYTSENERGRWLSCGGIASGVYGDKKNYYLYKCATRIKVSMNHGTGHETAGGLIGNNDNRYYGGAATVYATECFSALDLTVTGTAQNVHAGTYGFINNSVNYYNNVVGIFNLNNNFTSCAGNSYGATTSAGGLTKLNKAYLYVNYYVKGTATTLGAGQTTASNSQFFTNGLVTTPSGCTKQTTLANLWSQASGTSGLNGDIWNKGLLTTTNISNSAFANVLNIVTNPIFKNESKLTFLNLNGTSDEAIAATDFKTTMTGQSGNQVTLLATQNGNALPTLYNDPTNFKVFKGWSTSKSWTATPDVDFDMASMAGDVKLYAVWNMEGFTPTVTPDKTSAQTYSGSDLFTITAYPNTPATATNTVTWYKQGTATSVGSGLTHSIKDFDESGEYYVTVEAVDSVYPMWKTPATSQSAATVTLTIDKHQLKYKANSFALNSGVTAYEGQALSEITTTNFTANCLKDDNATPFTAGTFALTASGSATFAEGDNNVNLTFTPTDSSNYDGWSEPVTINAIKYEIEFKLYNDAGTYLNETIKLNDSHNTNIKYKGSIRGDDLMTVFKGEYDKKVKAAIDANDGSIYTQQKSTIPYVGLTSPVKWDAYSNATISLATPKSFDIKLQLQTYTFTFKYDNGGATPDRVDTVNLNTTASKPLSEPTKAGGWVFDDWYRMNSGIMEEDPWDFNTLITEDVTVQAKWVTINYVLHELVVTIPGELTADTALTGSELQVKAIFYEDDDTAKKKKETMLVKDTDYTISYPINNELHIVPTGDTQFTISYTKGSVTKTVNVDDATILQQEIDMTQYVEFTQTTFPWDGNAHAIKVQLKSGVTKYPDKVDETATVYTYSQGIATVAEADVKDSGMYSVKAEFVVKSAYATDYKIKAPIIVTLTILDKAIELEVTWDGDTFPYDHGNVICPKPTFTRADNGNSITLTAGTDYDITGDNAVTDVNNNYKITLTLIGNAATVYSIKDGKTAISAEKTFNITICELDTPYIADGTKIEYNGAPQEVKDSLTGYDATIMSVTNGGTQTNAKKNYKAYITLTDTTNYKWKDSATASVTVDWTISKRILDVIWDETEFVKKAGSMFSPKVDDLFEVCMIDRGQIDFKGQTDFVFDGDRDKINEGSYTISVSFSEKAENGWAANYELNPASATVDWVITPKSGMEIINIDWNLPNDGKFVYNKNIQAPNFEHATITFSDGSEVTGAKLAEIKAAFKMEGDATKSKYVGDYSATVSLGNTKYYIKSGATVNYSIVEDGEGNGAPPEGSETGGNGNPKPIDLSNLPIWQIIVMSISAVLIIAFACMASNFNSKRKKADADTAKYNKVAVGAGTAMAVSQFSFSPEDKMAGMPIGVWSVLAIGMAGIAAIMLVVMLMAQSKCNKAIAAKEEAFDAAEMRKEQLAAAKAEQEKEERRLQMEAEKQERLAREEREREERQRRDDDMKMMMASMMSAMNNRPEGGGGYAADNIELIVGKVMQAMLPTMQQMMLPGSTTPQPDFSYVQYDNMAEAQFVQHHDPDDEEDYEEDWDLDDDVDTEEILDETVEPITAEEAAKKLPSNFRMRVKETSEKNRDTYILLKNAFCSQKGVAARVCGRVEKLKYHGDIIAVIGIAKRSIKLWLALDPSEFDSTRYFQKDVSDKDRFKEVPMLVHVGSERSQKRTLELLTALFAKFGIEPRRKYEEKGLQELIYTLKGNALAKDPTTKHMLCESIHIADTEVMSANLAENCIETKSAGDIGVENFETVTLAMLDEAYLDGQKVTLENLKKRGLVSDSANGFRVTASDRLSKPLIVYANEFSIDAVKMIVLTGGRAIQLI